MKNLKLWYIICFMLAPLIAWGAVALLDSSGQPVDSLDLVAGKIRALATPYLYGIAEGDVPGHDDIDFSGRNPDVDAVEEGVWDQGGAVNWPAAATAMYISSSSASDTGDYVVTYLDAAYTSRTVTITAAGQTKTLIPTVTMLRVQRAENDGAADNVGDVYIYEDDTVTLGVPDTATKVYSKIPAGKNATQNGYYTVPLGKTAYITSWFASTSINASTSVTFYQRLEGKTFKPVHPMNLFFNGVYWPFELPHAIPEKTDIYIGATSTNGIVSTAVHGWIE